MKLIATTALAVCLAVPAWAQEQPQCTATEELTATLTEKYGETPAFSGLNPSGLVSIWINPDTGTWSAVMTAPSGVSCLVASGQNGELVPMPVSGDPT